jgi:ketosteroid isomerase-like protein
MPWIGTYHGRDAVIQSFGVFLSLVDVKQETLVRLIVDGEDAIGIVHEISTVKETGKDFEIEFVQWLTVRNREIVRWKSYTDPSSIISAMKV